MMMALNIFDIEIVPYVSSQEHGLMDQNLDIEMLKRKSVIANPSAEEGGRRGGADRPSTHQVEARSWGAESHLPSHRAQDRTQP